MLTGPVYGARRAQRASSDGGGGGPVVQGGAKEGPVRLPGRGVNGGSLRHCGAVEVLHAGAEKGRRRLRVGPEGGQGPQSGESADPPAP